MKTESRVVLLLLILIISTEGLVILWEFVLEDIILDGVLEQHLEESNRQRWEFVLTTLVFVAAASVLPGLQLFRVTKENVVLKAILPICANCKKIRDEQDSWVDIEVYIRDRSKTEFSHGICPECMKEHYPALCESGDDDTGKGAT